MHTESVISAALAGLLEAPEAVAARTNPRPVTIKGRFDRPRRTGDWTLAARAVLLEAAPALMPRALAVQVIEPKGSMDLEATIHPGPEGVHLAAARAAVRDASARIADPALRVGGQAVHAGDRAAGARRSAAGGG